MSIQELKVIISKQSRPSLACSHLLSYIRSEVEKGQMTLYEVYLLREEALDWGIKAKMQPAWGENSSLFDLGELVYHNLMCLFFRESNAKVIDYAESIIDQVRDKGGNYMLDLYGDIFVPEMTHETIAELQKARRFSAQNDYYFPGHFGSIPGELDHVERMILEHEEPVKEYRDEILDLKLWFSYLEF